MSLKTEFEEKFGNEYTLKRCRQKNCALKNVSNNKYFIINGDLIKDPDDKSVDCIIVDLEQNEENKYKIILCELTKGKKDINDAIKRFQSSGKMIITLLDDIDKDIYKIDCLFLGNITQNGKPIDKKVLILNKFRIEGFNKINLITNKNCGYDIAELGS